MKHITIIYLLVCILCAGCVHAERTVVGIWHAFLADPNDNTMNTLVSSISEYVSDCDWGNVNNYTAVPSDIRQNLFDSIASGNNFSLRTGLLVEQCLDGGDLGDFRRSAGQFFEKKPVIFMQEIKRSSVPTASYQSMVTMLPLTLVDDLNMQIKAIRFRIQLLKDIELSELEELKDIASKVLKDQELKLTDLQNQI